MLTHYLLLISDEIYCLNPSYREHHKLLAQIIQSMKNMTAHFRVLCCAEIFVIILYVCFLLTSIIFMTNRWMKGEDTEGWGEGTIMWRETTSVMLSFGECHKFEISGILSPLYI
jgi:hypothetical protein